MGELRLRSAAARRAGRRIAIVVGAVLVAAATASVGAAAAAPASAADDNATASDNATEPQVVDASIHELDDGPAVLVAVVETDGGTETVVAELGADSDGTEQQLPDGEHPGAIDLPNASADDLELLNASADDVGLPNASGGELDLSNASGGELNFAAAEPNGSPGDAGSPGTVDGGPIEWSIVDVPDALRSPPERLTRAVSREPAFGGGWLLPGALAALGGAMATLGVGALAIWRRTL